MSRSTHHLNHISISQFLTDLNMLPTHYAQSLHNSLIHTLDIHAPVLNKTSIVRPNTSSNLSIISKTLERVVSKQLSSFLTTNNILCTFQSAYVSNKSTETAITRVTTNILCDLNNTYGTILVLLDLSAAFDTIDYSLRISRLANIGNSLKWFTSYISDRTSSILINGRISSPRNISYGVPQGSVLGPILFNIYLFPIFDIFSNFPLIAVHSYADDIQLNVKCTYDINFAPILMSNCIKSNRKVY